MISIIFIILFLVTVWMFLWLLLKRNILSLRAGILAACIFFIWPSIIYLLIVGSLPVTFPNVRVSIIGLSDAKPLIWMQIYIAALLLYVAISENLIGSRNTRQHLFSFHNRNHGLFIFLSYSTISFLLTYWSGAFEGGHWAENKSELFESSPIIQLLGVSVWVFRFLYLACLFSAIKSGLHRKTYILSAIIITGLELLTGNRIYIALLGVTSFAYVLRTRNIKGILVLVALLPVLLWSALVYQGIRGALYSGVGDLAARLSIVTDGLSASNVGKVVLVGTESIDTSVTLQLFSEVGETINPIYGKTYLKSITWMVPRSVWDTKPLSITTLAGKIFGDGQLSLITTIFGESFYNFYLLGPLFMIVLLLAFEVISLFFIGNRDIGSMCARFALGFALFRMPFSDMCVVLAITGLWSMYMNLNHYHKQKGRALIVS